MLNVVLKSICLPLENPYLGGAENPYLDHLLTLLDGPCVRRSLREGGRTRGQLKEDVS